MAVSTEDDNVVLTKRIPLPNSDKEVLIITLNRPSKKNCFHTRLCHELAAIFNNVANEVQSYDATPIHNDDDNDQQKLAAVILTGAGKSFCAGADLSAPPNPLHQVSTKFCHMMCPFYSSSRAINFYIYFAPLVTVFIALHILFAFNHHYII